MTRATTAIMALALITSSTASAQSAQVSKATEEAAFAAVKAKRYCDAMALFLDAYALAPDTDLLFNAARAAELGGDRARALHLFGELLGRNTAEDRKVEARAKIEKLTKDLEKKGAGKSCRRASGETIVMPAPPPPDPPPPPPADPTTTTEPPPPPPADPPPVDPLPVEKKDPPPPPPPAPAPAAPPVWPWVAVGGGALALTAGAVTAAIGSTPWFAYADAQTELADAQRSGARDETDAYGRQLQAEREWQSYGQLSVAGGIAIAVVGVAAAGMGASLLMFSEDG